MAVANLDTNKIRAGFHTGTAIVETALDATAGGEFTVTNADERTAIIIHNSDASNAENVTIKAPAKPAMGTGAGYADTTISVAAGKTVVMMIETQKFMEADTHKVKLAGSADVKVTVVEL